MYDVHAIVCSLSEETHAYNELYGIHSGESQDH